MLYELATISCPLLDLDGASRRIDAWTRASQARGDLLGCWRTEIGVLGRLLVLRAFEDAGDLLADRQRALMASEPFGTRPGIDAIECVSLERFPFLPPVVPSRRGRVYEFRHYRLKSGGLAPTMEGWRAAIEPARDYTAHLVVTMHALDGRPSITHVWAFESLEERASLRSAAYGAGVWPPKNGPENIVEATSTIALPEAFSPLH